MLYGHMGTLPAAGGDNPAREALQGLGNGNAPLSFGAGAVIGNVVQMHVFSPGVEKGLPLPETFFMLHCTNLLISVR